MKDYGLYNVETNTLLMSDSYEAAFERYLQVSYFDKKNYSEFEKSPWRVAFIEPKTGRIVQLDRLIRAVDCRSIPLSEVKIEK